MSIIYSIEKNWQIIWWFYFHGLWSFSPSFLRPSSSVTFGRLAAAEFHVRKGFVVACKLCVCSMNTRARSGCGHWCGRRALSSAILWVCVLATLIRRLAGGGLESFSLSESELSQNGDAGCPLAGHCVSPGLYRAQIARLCIVNWTSYNAQCTQTSFSTPAIIKNDIQANRLGDATKRSTVCKPNHPRNHPRTIFEIENRHSFSIDQGVLMDDPFRRYLLVDCLFARPNSRRKNVPMKSSPAFTESDCNEPTKRPSSDTETISGQILNTAKWELYVNQFVRQARPKWETFSFSQTQHWEAWCSRTALLRSGQALVVLEKSIAWMT